MCLFYVQDSTSLIPLVYEVEAVPTTFIINKYGRIIKHTIGAENWDNEEFVEELKNLVE